MILPGPDLHWVGLLALRDFCNIFLPNIDEDQKKYMSAGHQARRFPVGWGVVTPPKIFIRGSKEWRNPNNNEHVCYLSWILTKYHICLDRFFLLKILKTIYHSARPRFYSNIHNNTSMFITHPIYCIIFILCTSQTHYCDCVSVSEVLMRKVLPVTAGHWGARADWDSQRQRKVG